jgi:excisionase family DNA binding protein
MGSTTPLFGQSQQSDATKGEPGSVSDIVAALRDIAVALHALASNVPPDPVQLLRADQVAELLELPARTIHDQAAAGAIPHRRFGKHYRFSRADVEEIVQQMARTARPRRPFRAA